MYRRAFRPKLDIQTQQVAHVLRSVDMFSEFNRGAIRNIAEAIHVRAYKRDEFIYRERDPGLGMYVVQSGRVTLFTEEEDGSLHELRLASDFEVFGHFALLGDFRRFETAQAVTETTVLGFFRPELKAMIKRDPRTAVALLSVLAGYTAEQHVALYNVLVQKEGKVAATRLHEVATKRMDPQSLDPSFIVRP